MRRGLLFLALFLVVLLAPVVTRYVRYYGINRQVTAVPPPNYVPGEVVDRVSIPIEGDFEDRPEIGAGLILLDRAHDNDFTRAELGFLDGRLAARGYEMLTFNGGDLAAALRPVDAFVVVTPQRDFGAAEIDAVADFVDRGGRLLMIGDPTRFNFRIIEEEFDISVVIDHDNIPLNTLANAFGIVFNGDYLYNTLENEGNFRNILLSPAGFGDGELTANLAQLAFYGSHSLTVGASGRPLLVADRNTRTSATDRAGGLALAVMAAEDRVLALGDLHFMTEPYYTAFDNGAFIARVADFLTGGDGRDLVLADFPFFLAPDVDLVYIGEPDLGPDAFDDVIALQNAFATVDRSLTLRGESRVTRDTLYLGLYNQAEDVADLLEAAGVALVIDPPLPMDQMAAESDAESEAQPEATPTAEAPTESMRLLRTTMGNLQMSGSALLLLKRDSRGARVVVLAASGSGLEAAVDRLMSLINVAPSEVLRDCLRSDTLAICPTNITGEAVEARLETGGTPDAVSTTETPTPPADPDGGDGEGPVDETTLDAAPQGSISLDESVEGALAVEESHAWIFSDGPAKIDITLETDENMDGVLAIYDPDDVLIASADNTFSGETERLSGIDVPDNGDYSIIVSAFFGAEGGYTLTVAPAASASGTALIYVDDNGAPIGDGFDSALALVAAIGDDLDVSIWRASEDGPLPEGFIDDFALVIWDSGDYETELFDDDGSLIFDYLIAGGNLYLTGSSPGLFNTLELAPLNDIEVGVGEGPLFEGLAPGEVIALLDTVNAAVVDPEDADISEEDTILFLRGPGSDATGAVATAAFMDESVKIYAMMFPFVVLPPNVQEVVMGNLLTWFGLR